MNIYEKKNNQVDMLIVYIKSLMKKNKITQAQIAKTFGRKQPWFSKKLNEGDFNLHEMMLILFFLRADADAIGNLMVIKRGDNE